MAQRVTVELEGDLDGGPAVETVRFGFGGSEYEIDLSAKNASALRQASLPTSTMPVRPGQGHVAGRHVPGQPAGKRRDPRVGERAGHRRR
jgi:hypothetical protein